MKNIRESVFNIEEFAKDINNKLTCLSFFFFKRYFNVLIIYFFEIIKNTRRSRDIVENIAKSVTNIKWVDDKTIEIF